MEKEKYLFKTRDIKILYKENDVYVFSSDIGELEYVKDAETAKCGSDTFILTGYVKKDFESEIYTFNCLTKGYKDWHHIKNYYFNLIDDRKYRLVQEDKNIVKLLDEVEIGQLYKMFGEKLIEYAKSHDKYLEFQINELLEQKNKEKAKIDFIEKASKEENRVYYVYSKKVNIKLLERSGYRFLHEPYFAMMGKTRNKHSINPYTQEVVDAAPFIAIPIHWSEFLEKFGHKINGADDQI